MGKRRAEGCGQSVKVPYRARSATALGAIAFVILARDLTLFVKFNVFAGTWANIERPQVLQDTRFLTEVFLTILLPILVLILSRHASKIALGLFLVLAAYRVLEVPELVGEFIYPPDAMDTSAVARQLLAYCLTIWSAMEFLREFLRVKTVVAEDARVQTGKAI